MLSFLLRQNAHIFSFLFFLQSLMLWESGRIVLWSRLLLIVCFSSDWFSCRFGCGHPRENKFIRSLNILVTHSNGLHTSLSVIIKPRSILVCRAVMFVGPQVHFGHREHEERGPDQDLQLHTQNTWWVPSAKQELLSWVFSTHYHCKSYPSVNRRTGNENIKRKCCVPSHFNHANSRTHSICSHICI